MFEKEAEEYFETECLHSYADTEEQLKEDVVPAFQKGATFGYNKAKEEGKIVVEHFEAYGQCRDSRRIVSLEAENEELKRDKEDLIFVCDQRAKCMCEDKERLTKAKEIIRRLMDIINHDLKCFDTMAGLDVKQKAEQFLKETTDIREASTLDGDWVVDEH